MAPDVTFRMWKRIFFAHEDGTLMNPDKPGTTFLEEFEEAQQKQRARHEKKKSATPFEEKPYVCKPLTRETFKNLAGLTRADYLLCAQRILEVRENEVLPRVTLRTSKTKTVATLKSWCNTRKWKNILLQELSSRDTKERGIWGKDADGHDALDRDVWTKFKIDHSITKAKWMKLFQVAGSDWLNKKRLPNNKYLDAPPACDRLLLEWLEADVRECSSSVVTRWVDYNSIKRQLVIPPQDNNDLKWLGNSDIAAGFMDFRFIPGSVDQPVSIQVVDSLVKYIDSPTWSPGIKIVPCWMIVSDIRSHTAAVEFMSILSRRHPDTFITVPSFYFPCPAEDLPLCKDVDSKRTSPALYVDFFTSKNLPKFKMFPCPMIAPPTQRYTVNPKQWSEMSYEVSRGELRMETYLTFLSHLGCSGAVVINFFGGLKPIAAALVSFI